MKPDTNTLALTLALLNDPDSIATLLDFYRPIETPPETPAEPPASPPEQPETLFGHYQSRKPEKGAPNQHRRWTPTDRARLIGLRHRGWSLEEIAEQLQRTQGGVKRQIDKLEGRA